MTKVNIGTNRAFWSQQRLFDVGAQEIGVEIRVHLNGNDGTMSFGAVITTAVTGEWLEATTPYWSGTREDLPGLLVALEDLLIEADTYVTPF